MLTKDQLIQYFIDGEKIEKNFKIGTEHEKFIFNLYTKKPVEYSQKEFWVFLKF
jgi:glutamate--cysteine ligase